VQGNFPEQQLVIKPMQINIGLYGKELEILKVHRTSAVRRKKYEQIAVYFSF